MKNILLNFIAAFSFVISYAQNDTLNPKNHVGETVTISGRIFAGNYLIHVKTKPTFLSLYDSLPNHRLMLRIDSADREKFKNPPEVEYLNKQISITGVIENYKGIPLIKVDDPAMIQQVAEKRDTILQTNLITNNRYNSYGKSGDNQLKKQIPDTVLQSKWVKGVADKAQQQTLTDIWIVQKELPLRVNPSKNAPIIADIQPGIAISILYTSNRWSYVTVKKPDGTGGIYGFIKKRMQKFLKKEEKN